MKTYIHSKTGQTVKAKSIARARAALLSGEEKPTTVKRVR